jgi:mono/diheme cytochrome c family protein
MKKSCSLGLALALAAAAWLFGQGNVAEQGNYLVNNVAMCGDCHTPRLPDGRFDTARLLKGAPLDFAPLKPVPGWASRAPDLTATGPLMWSQQQLLTFLETGRDPKGNLARPPMPVYRMRPQDAQAVLEYLKTLR